MYGNYGINPFYNAPRYQQPMEQPTQQYVPPTQVQIPRTGLQGKQVDSVDVVRGTDIPLDGSISYFPLVDNSAIVTKQLQNDGTSKITIFKPITETKEEVKYITPKELEKAIDELNMGELDDIKDELKEIRNEIKEIKKKKKDD